MKLYIRSNQSQRIKVLKRCLHQQNDVRLPMSEIELHGDKNKSKKEPDKKSYFSKFNLKLIRTNSYKLKSLTRWKYRSWVIN